MSDAIERSGSRPRLTDTIVENIKCVKCGYNLRGLRDEGICPECGLSVCQTLTECKLGFWNRFEATWFLALMFAALHFILVAILAIVYQSPGESPAAWIVGIVDMPLWWLLHCFQISGSKLHVVIGGTLMYAIFGAMIGLFFDRLRRKARSRRA